MRKNRLLGALLAFVVAASVGGGMASPPTAVAAGAPPACRYDDVLTHYTSPRSWRVTLVDTIYMLPQSYMPPPGLVSTDLANVAGKEQLRKFVIADLRELIAASRAAGVRLKIESGYRGWKQQKRLYNREVANLGLEAGRMRVARPGHSEHHLGTAIDFASPDDSRATWNYDDWAQTPAGGWLRDNAWRYGFVMSYPKGKESVTCYQYEPWHYRYVGGDAAARIRESGLTLREYLWSEFH